MARIKIVPHQRPVRVREPGRGWSAGSGQRRPDREPILGKAPYIYRNLPSPTLKTTVKIFIGVVTSRRSTYLSMLHVWIAVGGVASTLLAVALEQHGFRLLRAPNL